MTENKLVSCLMPTYNRRPFIQNAIRYFLNQDYEPKELIILDDGSDSVEDLIFEHPQIRYFRLPHKITLGEKLNQACEIAKGDILIHWDDDDWYASRRISYQVHSLLNAGAYVCGINHLLYFDFKNSLAYKYELPANYGKYLLGSTLCYTREAWQNNKFDEIQVGMDGLFVDRLPPDKVLDLPDITFAVFMIHSANISPKQTTESYWSQISVEEIKKILEKEDAWKYYQSAEKQNENIKDQNDLKEIDGKGIAQERYASTENIKLEKRPFKNVFACLVHEKEKCVLDLIKNLKFLDSNSEIILYNGGNDLDLLSEKAKYEEMGAYIHPNSEPQKMGDLVGFALSCMSYSIEHFDFDTLTIIDSDQLLIRKGFTAYLEEYLDTKENAGILVTDKQHYTNPNGENKIVNRAHLEKNLWLPLLSQFSKGNNSFVHWTFWPGTVFTKSAIVDLLGLFGTNLHLQLVYHTSQIWAKEEVFFPTLVKMLGYNVFEKPFNPNYLQYKKDFSLNQVSEAFSDPNAFFIHPVIRDLDNPIRAFIRNHFNEYDSFPANKRTVKKNPKAALFKDIELLQKANSIKGWKHFEEIKLIAEVAEKVAKSCETTDLVVEINSFYGKGTVVLGSIFKQHQPAVKILAINHLMMETTEKNGVLPFEENQIDTLKTSLESFEVDDQVEVVFENDQYQNWKTSIAFLLIDGIHNEERLLDYYNNFKEQLKSDSYLLVHDYVKHYPGVVMFVDNLIEEGKVKVFKKEGSLIALNHS